MAVYKKLVLNTLLFAVGGFGSRIINLALLPLYTRCLNPKDYGRIDILNTTASLIFPLITFQIFDALFRFGAELKSPDARRKIFSSSINFFLITMLFLLLFIPFFGNFRTFSGLILYLYLITFLLSLSSGLKNYLRATDRISIYTFSEVLYSIIFSGLNFIFLVLLRMELKGYLLAYILTQLCVLGYILIRARLYREYALYLDLQTLKLMLRYSLPLVPNSFTFWVVNVSDRYIVNHFLGIDATGIYSVSARLSMVLTLIYAVFFQAWQISAIEEYGKGTYKRIFEEIFDFLSAMLFLVTSIMLILLKWFVRIFVGQEYFQAWMYLPFLLLGGVFQAFSTFYGTNYIVSKNTSGLFYTSLIAAITNFTINILLIDRIGIQAASVSTYVAYLLMWILRIFQSSKIVDVRPKLSKTIVATVLLTVQSFVVITFDSKIGLVCSLATFCVVFITFVDNIVKTTRFTYAKLKHLATMWSKR